MKRVDRDRYRGWSREQLLNELVRATLRIDDLEIANRAAVARLVGEDLLRIRVQELEDRIKTNRDKAGGP